MNPEYLKSIAFDLAPILSSNWPPVELVAAASPIAQELAGGARVTKADWKAAVARYVNELPDDEGRAELIVKQDASRALEDPQLLEEYETLIEARRKLEDAQYAIDSAKARAADRVYRLRQLETELPLIKQKIARWSFDIDLMEKQAEETILSFFGEQPSNLSRALHAQLDSAWLNLARAETFRKLAPIALEKLRKGLQRTEEGIAELRPAPKAPVAPIVLVRGRQQLSDPN